MLSCLLRRAFYALAVLLFAAGIFLWGVVVGRERMLGLVNQWQEFGIRAQERCGPPGLEM